MDTKTRADLAAQVLNNPVFIESFDIVRNYYLDKLVNTAADDDESRKRFYFSIHALEAVRTALTASVQNGKIDQIQAEKKEKAKK